MLEQSGHAREDQIAELKKQVTKVSQTIRALDASRSVLQGVALDESTFQDFASFRYSRFLKPVDFSMALFEDRVDFREVTFGSDVLFDHAVLRRASFNGTDLRGADLSHAIIDENTKLPK